MATPTPTPRRRSTPIFAAVALAVIVASAAVAAYIVTRDRTNQPTTTIGEAAPSITITGELQLDDINPGWTVGDYCHALSRGYADITEGAQITVTNQGGDVVAIGKLGAGKVAVHPVYGDPAKICVFPIQVTGVPTGLSLYGVEVSHRGVVRFSELDLMRPIVLKLG